MRPQSHERIKTGYLNTISHHYKNNQTVVLSPFKTKQSKINTAQLDLQKRNEELDNTRQSVMQQLKMNKLKNAVKMPFKQNRFIFNVKTHHNVNNDDHVNTNQQKSDVYNRFKLQVNNQQLKLVDNVGQKTRMKILANQSSTATNYRMENIKKRAQMEEQQKINIDRMLYEKQKQFDRKKEKIDKELIEKQKVMMKIKGLDHRLFNYDKILLQNYGINHICRQIVTQSSNLKETYRRSIQKRFNLSENQQIQTKNNEPKANRFYKFRNNSNNEHQNKKQRVTMFSNFMNQRLINRKDSFNENDIKGWQSTEQST